MHWAAEAALDNGAINPPHLLRERLILDANHNAIGMKEVLNGRTFTKEFRIRNYAETNIAVSRIGGKRPAQFDPSARRHSTLLDYELWRTCFSSNLPRCPVDG